MAFVPRLPTFHIPVQTYLKLAAAGEWQQGPQIMAQVYFPQRGQPGTPFATIYLLYPKESNFLRDASQLGQDPFYDELAELDIVEFRYPTDIGDLHRYKVMQVCPRWLGFPNEHIGAYLKELLPEEWDAVSVNPPPTWPGEFEFTLTSVPNDVCTDCDELEDTWSLPVVIADQAWQSADFAWSCDDEDFHWVLGRAGIDLWLYLMRIDAGPTDTVVAAWKATDVTGWNGTDPIDMDRQSIAIPYCDFPATITVDPA